MKFPDALSDCLVQCPQCGDQRWHRSTSLWCCGNGHSVRTVNGLPDFSVGNTVSTRDKALQSRLYNGLLGRYYGFMMPLLAMPARPVSQSVPQWGVFFGGWVAVLAILYGWIHGLGHDGGVMLWACTLLLAVTITFFHKHRYLLWLMVLAIPVKLILLARRFKPVEAFPAVHRRLVSELKEKGCERVLDVSTGTCNSLLRHGWTDLDAEFYGVDLSPVMLQQGADNAAQANVAVNLFLADAQAIPLPDEAIDLVLNYGALNGYDDQSRALTEMARVLKPGGKLVCLDEQLYEAAGYLETLYFNHVLAAHDSIDRFPASAVPDSLSVVEHHQIYQFYYLVVLEKK